MKNYTKLGDVMPLRALAQDRLLRDDESHHHLRTQSGDS